MEMSKWFVHGKKIVCVGRNYAAHAKELGNAVPTSPFFFLKPTTSYVREGSPILLPRALGEIHHEGDPRACANRSLHSHRMHCAS
jgi:acylpyruvate hydrolase